MSHYLEGPPSIFTSGQYQPIDNSIFGIKKSIFKVKQHLLFITSGILLSNLRHLSISPWSFQSINWHHWSS